jgi:hypothetical protein
MEQIDKNEINDLLTIIPRDYPSFEVFHLTDCENDMCKVLNDLCDSQNYGYDKFIADEDFLKKRRFNSQSKVYDILFLQIDLKNIEDINLFYKKLYPISKNGSKLIFILKKSEDIYLLAQKLEDENYVAINPIDNTFSNYQILSATKMHGWGN